MKNSKRPGRILIFELNWMGDILFSFPFIRAIRRFYADAHIACAVVPRYKDMLTGNPWVDTVHVLSDNSGLLSFPEKWTFIKTIKKEKYDVCFMLKPSRTKTIMAALAGISRRVGFAGKKAPLTEKVEAPRACLHRADQIFTLATTEGITVSDGDYEYFVGKEDEEKALSLLREVGSGLRKTVAINPGGNWDAKRWPAEKFVRLAKMILEHFGDVEIIITGSEKDAVLARTMSADVADRRCYALAGRTKLNELAALFKMCVLVISADSGPLHLASAAGSATLGLFGPTSCKITGPRGKGKNVVISADVNCETPCYVENCEKDHECMKAISVEEVFKAAEGMLGT